MFSSALRYRALGSVLRPRAIPYVTLAAADLRRLQINELVDTVLAERDRWSSKLIVEKDAASMLKDQLLAERAQLLASESRRNAASEAKIESQMKLTIKNIRFRELQIALLRSQNRFNLRGIIESIAEQPDYDGMISDEERMPSSRRGTQARLDWLIDNSPAYAHFREKILKHRQVRRADFDHTGRRLYHELSKHFHENRIASDMDAKSIIVDMTQDFNKGVFTTLDGAVLESFLHYRHIPYTAISDNVIEEYTPGKPGGDLECTILPAGYRDQVNDTGLGGDKDSAGDKEDMENTVSMNPV